jgi:hypothetical protein
MHFDKLRNLLDLKKQVKNFLNLFLLFINRSVSDPNKF